MAIKQYSVGMKLMKLYFLIMIGLYNAVVFLNQTELNKKEINKQ